MIRALARHGLTLALAGVAWLSLLWFVLMPDFSRWSPLTLVGGHLIPPLAVWGVWLGWRWRRHRREAALAAERERRAAAEREAALAEARARHEQELARRRYGCDCRALALVAPLVSPDDPPLTPAAGICFSAAPASDAASVQDVAPMVEEALGRLCAVAPPAAAFPVFILPPADVPAQEAIAVVQRGRKRIAEALGHPPPDTPVRFLPAADHVANAAIGLFEAGAELPGAVVLAWERAARQTEESGASPSSATADDPTPLGTAVALLFTHPELEAMLDALETRTSAGDARPGDGLTPFWLRVPETSEAAPLLARLSLAAREALRSMPVLARIHRAATAQAPETEGRVSRLAALVETLLEQACVDAGLAPLPFAEAGGQPKPEPPAPAEWGWLVHNAGPIERAGPRLAAVGSAMSALGSELHPIDMATNVSTYFGATGSAASAVMLALTVARAATLGLPALCTEFRGGGGVGLFFAVPVRTI